MHISSVYILTTLLALTTMAPWAQDAESESRKLNQEAQGLYQQGDYARAMILVKKALELAEKTSGPDHPDVALSLNNLAELYKTQGQYAPAEHVYKRALAIIEKALGPDHPHMANTLSNLASFYRATKRVKEAKALEQRAKTIMAIKR